MTEHACEERQSCGVREQRAPRCQRLAERKVRGRWLCWSHALLDERDCPPPERLPLIRFFVAERRNGVIMALPAIAAGDVRIEVDLESDLVLSQQPWARRLGELLRLCGGELVNRLDVSVSLLSRPELLREVLGQVATEAEEREEFALTPQGLLNALMDASLVECAVAE